MANTPKKEDHDKIEEAVVISETTNDTSVVEFGELMSIVLDYYASTGYQPLDSGEEWKDLNPDEYRSKGIEIPEELDGEIKKAFISQIKKYQ